MNENYQRQLNEKVTRIGERFAEFLLDNGGNADSEKHGNLDVFASPTEHFRQRAEFRVWHSRGEGADEAGAFYAMFEPGQRAGPQTLKRTDQLMIADRRINALMPTLLTRLQAEPVLIQRLYQVEFLSTLAGDMLVTLIYHKVLDDAWQAAAKPLETALGIFLVGRSRKQKVVLSQDFVTEVLHVNGEAFRYRQIEGGFTQPNATVCEAMLTWACDAAKAMSTKATGATDLLELYCGNGNFTLPLSRHFRRVLATEVAKTSVFAARHNIAANNAEHIAVARLSAQELTEAFAGQRVFKRLQQDNIDIDDYDIKTVFVDPPRAGVDAKTLALMQQFEHILYISCNPDTLYPNLQVLTSTHHVESMALFDQFPYTQHVEMGVWLRF